MLVYLSSGECYTYVMCHVSLQPTQQNKYSLAPEDGRINV